MSAIYLAFVFGVIATLYFFTTGDVAGTFGVIFWYVFYVGAIEIQVITDKVIADA